MATETAGIKRRRNFLLCGAGGLPARWWRRQGPRAVCACAAGAAQAWTTLAPAPEDGHTHEAHSHAVFNGETPAWWLRPTVQGREISSARRP